LAVLGRLGKAELVALLAEEHPQTVAIVLSHVPPEKAAGVLASFSTGRQAQVARRVATLDRPDEAILRQIEQGLMRRLAEADSVSSSGPVSPGGPDAVVAMLRHTDAAVYKAVLRELDAEAPAVAEVVRGRLMGFTELDGVPAAVLSAALSGMESREIALALCAAEESVVRRVLGGLESSRSRAVRAAMGKPGPMRLCDVEAAQESLVEAVRRQGREHTYRSSRVAEPALSERDVWRE